MRISGSHLAQKETEILSAANAIENKTIALRTAEDEAVFKKITAAAYIRQASMQARSLSSRNVAPVRSYIGALEDAAPADRRNDTRPESAVYPRPVPSALPSSGAQFGSDADRRVANELKNIRRSLTMSKLATKSSSATNRSMTQFSTDYNYDWQGL